VTSYFIRVGDLRFLSSNGIFQLFLLMFGNKVGDKCKGEEE
jgi:hypothetical protein